MDYDGQWVAPLGDDLVASDMWYIVTGTAPNRILTVEWAVTEYGSNGSAMLQVNMYETTNVLVTQTMITTPFTFGGDGVVGINAGDAVWGEELFCGASGTIPSNDFDVQYQPPGPPPTPTPAREQPVPTMSRWGITIFLVTLAAAAILILRRRL